MEIFYLAVAFAIEKANTEDFDNEEIRVLAPEKDIPLSDISHWKWDGRLDKKKPIHGDIGINKQKDIFRFTQDKWLKI